MPEKNDVARPRLGQRVPSGPRPPSSRPSATTTSGLSLSAITGGAPSVSQTFTSERWVPDGDAGLTHSPPPATPDATTLPNPFDAITPNQTSPDDLPAGTMLSTAISPIKEIRKQNSTPLLSIKPKPKPLKVNTNLLPPSGSSPKKSVSPSLQHWQQIRSHVLTTPLEEKVPVQLKAKSGLVGKAAAKFGFRQGSEDAYGTMADRKGTLDVKTSGSGGGLSEAEKEEIARERRRFARDIKTCLDACALEESRRRLKGKGRSGLDRPGQPTPYPLSNTTFNPDFSAFAPLLTELHKYLPAARARKAWSRTCPHHNIILAELSTAFLPGGSSTTGERQQALEVFGVIVRSWAADGKDEELSRWLWLCQALTVGDRQLRNRGLVLLSSFLHHDPTLPTLGEMPNSRMAIQGLAVGLLQLLCAVEMSEYDSSDHRQTILGLLVDLVEGNIVELKEDGKNGSQGQDGKVGGVEKELMWSTMGRSLNSAEMVEWLFAPDNPTLLRFAPPPLLHATPPQILQFRLQAIIVFLRSLAIAIPSLDPVTIIRVYHTLQDLIIGPLAQIPGDMVEVASARAGFLIACLMYSDRRSTLVADPFLEPLNTSANRTYLDAVVSTLKSGEKWAKGLEGGLQAAVNDVELDRVLHLLEILLSEKYLRAFTTIGLDTLFKRIEKSPHEADKSRDFLLHLSKSHPQQYYKPLFSLSASSQSSTAVEHLRTIRALARTTGRAHFWLDADPQMVAVVLMGDGAPIKSKGKGKEGVREIVNVRIGRYAVLVEFLVALNQVEGVAKAGSGLRAFLGGLESKVGTMLQTLEVSAVLPDSCRGLLVLLFRRIRTITQSARKAGWQNMVLSWFFDAAVSLPSPNADNQGRPLTELRDIYRSIVTITPTPTTAPQRKGTTATDITLHTPPPPPADPTDPYLHPNVLNSAIQLLVLLQSCWTVDDWSRLLPVVWNLLGSDCTPVKPLLFLLQKCGEMVPAQLRDVVETDLNHPSPALRSSANGKLAMLYAYRYQITSQPTLNPKRGPLFQFEHETLDFVITEIGSPTWSAPHDVKQEALQKYGSNLPVEVRQRLMELGWNDDPGLETDEGNPAEPISSFPIRHLLENGANVESDRSGLGRRGSGDSGSDAGGTGRKGQRAIFAPVLWETGAYQALQSQVGNGWASSSLGLVRMLQRDEPNLFIRPFADRFSVDFRGSLSRLNAAAVRTTPGFAYIAFNAVVGYLKQSLRQLPILDGYAYALAILATLVANVPEVSLREIRKHKAEHVLLPASIHEEEGGFRVHAPWRDGDGRVDVQSAQLLLVTEILKVNPREVHIIKRMMSNLQLQKSSLADRTFCRAWLNLIITLFGLVSRTYNDRAELRHFLTIATVILRTHQSDLLIVTLAVRLFMLCSARFRRLFAIMGFQTIMRAVYDTYSAGHSATRDCIEYAMRSHYRIHQDAFVYQACLAISTPACDFPANPDAVYSLLSSLSEPNTASHGVSSGVRGTNDKEEHEALIQMLSGPEIALAEIGKDRAERQAQKLAQAALTESRLFPRESIVRLFVTVIAANPPSVVAVGMLNLFVGMVPCIEDEASRRLLQDGVEALGAIISRERVDAGSAGLMGDEADGGGSDWASAKTGYLRLVEVWIRTGGSVSSSTTKIVLDMILSLLDIRHDAVFPVGTSLLCSLTSSHLESDKPAVLLKATSNTFQAALGLLDVSAVLDMTTAWIRRNEHAVDSDIARVIVDLYLRPAIRYLIGSQDPGPGHLRQSTVSLLAATVLLQAGAIDVLEEEPPSLELLAYIVLPLITSFEPPTGAEYEKRAGSFWIRILNLTMKPPLPYQSLDPRRLALFRALSLQVIKVVCVRAVDTISAVPGLWSYIARYLVVNLAGSRPSLPSADRANTVRLVDIMAWSLYELLALHRSPLMLHMRYHIQSALAGLDARPMDPSYGAHGHVGSPSRSHLSDFGPEYHAGRIPSLSLRRPSTQTPTYPSQSPYLSNSPSSRRTRLSPSPEPHNRFDFLSPRLSPSLFDSSGPGNNHRAPRPSFSDLSIRRASRPILDHPTGRATGPGGTQFRFPSSADTRKVGAGGAIVHLLGASSGVAGITGGGLNRRGSEVSGMDMEMAVNEVELIHAESVDKVERSIKACRVIFGYPVEMREDEEPVKAWSVYVALLEISRETRILVEVEFGDLFGCQGGMAGAGPAKDIRGSVTQDVVEMYGETAEDEDGMPLLRR